MDKGKEVVKDIEDTYYQEDTYVGGVSQTLNFKPDLYRQIQDETDELKVTNKFKTNWFPGNKSIRYIAEKHERTIYITSINGKARIHLVTDELIKREIAKISPNEVRRYKNVYFGGVEFSIKAYFQKNIDTPIQIYIVDDRILNNLQDALISVIKMDSNKMITKLWVEIVQKEQLKTLIEMVSNISEERIRIIVKEKLTKLYGEPQQDLEREDKQIIYHQPQMLAINAWRRTNEPILVDISTSKSEISNQVNKTLDGLGDLYRKRKF